jgi:hypothetical protein
VVYPPGAPIQGVAGELEALLQAHPLGVVSLLAVLEELAGCRVQVEVLAEAGKTSGNLSIASWGFIAL